MKVSIPYLIVGLLITFYCNYSHAQDPVLQISANPTTCNGSEGSITFSSLTPNSSYQVTYTDDGVTIGPVTIVSNAAGQITIPNLNAGRYSRFIFNLNGSIKQLLTGTVLSNPNYTPTFAPIPSICQGDPPPALPSTSIEGYSGSWTPGVVDNQQTGKYFFIPTPGTCVSEDSITIVVQPPRIPVFSFGTSLTICGSGSVPVLPNTSLNGITGTWSPAVVDPTRSGTYIFTPTTTGCVTGTSFTVIFNPVITPSFPFGTSANFCVGEAVPTLPQLSSNGITGTWSPAVVSNTTSGTYTFTPDVGLCAIPITYSVTVYPVVTPVFSLGNTASICSGATAPVLPATSNNGITGIWTPATVSNTASGTYTFQPTSNPCAPSVTLTVTVNPVITPTFSFGTSVSICEGDAAPVLPTSSSNGITGTWTPSVVNNMASGTYTFNATADPCAPPVTLTVTVNPVITPVFSFGPSAAICAGDAVPLLPNTSLNGISGTWNPAVVSNTVSGVYTFTSTTPCTPPVTFTVTVNPIITPAFSFGTSQSVCINSTPPVLPTVSNNGVSGTWSPSIVDNQQTATYTFTPAAGQCAIATTFSYEVNPIPAVINIRNDTTIYDGDALPLYNFTASIPVTALNWTNSNPSIGLPASGSGPVPSFTGSNMSDDPITGIITATPHVNGCTGITQSYRITVLPRHKDIFVPNVFSPNNDGKNDKLYAYGNYIATMEMHIFNQWGQRLATLTDKNQGWDGKFRGSPQPVGVYVYVLKAVTTDGRTVTKKGSITLVR